MKKQVLTLPNCMTLLRMVGTVCLLFTRPLSLSFFLLYTLTGLTDALDGWLARRMGLCSPLGAKLDSWADLLFYGVMLLKLFPLIFVHLPRQIWYAVGAIVLIRLGSYLTAAVKFRCFSALHTKMNKLSGLAVFGLPYLFSLPWGAYYCWAVCAFAGIAAADELTRHLQSAKDS